ncbi:MAG: FtsW/RodA/SpoVE family cell cycle protein [Clostridiales bacterium]|jgi:cell division protein FtsW (lipid II flippase)|nr:FtsW/RodA/SpoVE family cell cycle protein [Eubacteriales bacterium]MDH7567226.1 FtsW/RodA/SpoVE family cell cycle protein [Clostridiales bacterium]
MQLMRSAHKLPHPVYMLVLVDIFAFSLLFFRETPYDISPLIVGLSLIASILMVYFLIRGFKLGDEYIFLIVSMLFSIGAVMLYRLDSELGIKQAKWLGIGLVAFFAGYFIFGWFKVWDRLLFFYMAASMGLFAVTMGFGREIKGSNNWIVFQGFSIQTSEIAKILFLFFLASYYSQREKLFARFSKVRVTAAFMLVAYLLMGLLVLQKEWGTPLVLFLVYFAVIYIFEKDVRILLVNALAAVTAGTAGVLFVHHIRVRVDAWINPWADIAQKGYQIAQSLFAIGAGGFFGTGIGLGRPELIPEVRTDFIFSAICEEMGIFGGVAVILLFLLLVYRGFKIALRCGEVFEKTLALGITLMFAFQTFVIIGGVIKLLLLTGITLPFISYGGSSLVTNFAALGVLQRISAKQATAERSTAYEDR